MMPVSPVKQTGAITVEARSQDLPSVLDASAIDQVNVMVAQGWEVTTAAAAWLSWVEGVAAAAADGAVAEVAWRSP